MDGVLLADDKAAGAYRLAQAGVPQVRTEICPFDAGLVTAVAAAALRACGLDFGGVDMIEDADGVVRVLEVDAWAGFAGITTVTGADVAGTILDQVTARHARGPAR